MAEIKIPFTKNKVSDIPASELSPGARGLQLEITTNFLVFDLAGSFEKAVPPVDSKVPFKKIAFIFDDNNTETAAYQALRDNNQKQFELSFDKEKVYLQISGFSNHINLTKPQVHVNFQDLVIFFGPKSSGITKLTTSQGPTGPETPPTISQIRNNAIAAIKQALNSEPKLTANDLSSEYQNWETTINNSSNENQINSFKEQTLNDIKSKRTERERERAKWVQLEISMGNWRNSIICGRNNIISALNKDKEPEKQVENKPHI